MDGGQIWQDNCAQLPMEIEGHERARSGPLRITLTQLILFSMSSSTEDGGVSTQTVLLAAAVVLVVASVPWWIQALIVGSAQGDSKAKGAASEADTAMVEQPPTQQTQADGAEAAASSDCTVTVLPTSVRVKRSPTGIDAGYARAESGEYAALGYKVLEGEKEAQGWYKIQVEDKKGWIQHNSLTVLESGACPP